MKILERHVLVHREAYGAKPMTVKICPTYLAAIVTGIRILPKGQWWVESERKSPGSKKWTEFAPKPPSSALIHETIEHEDTRQPGQGD